MHVLSADGAAIGLLQRSFYVPQLGSTVTVVKSTGIEGFIKISRRKPVIVQLEDWRRRPLHHRQGIDIRALVAAMTIGRNKILYAHLAHLVLI